MKRRLPAALAAVAAAAGLAGCAGPDTAPAPASQGVPPPATTGFVPTPAQLAYRKELLKQIEDGAYVRCGCTAELRAKERIASGKAKPPPADQSEPAQP